MAEHPKYDLKDREDVQNLVSSMLDEAQNFIDEQLSEDREKATDYYHARPFGNEEEGRSKVVMPRVRDVTLGIMPGLMRVFFGPEHVVEFRPRGAEDEETAKQKTDYVNYCVMEDNPGFLTLYSAFKDALVRRLGVVKFWWEEKHFTEGHTFTGLTRDDLLVLHEDEDATIDSIEQMGEVQGEPLFTANVTRLVRDGKVRIESLPGEEFLFSRNARTVSDARIVAHQKEVMKSDLIAMGYDEDDIEDAVGTTLESGDDSEMAARRFDEGDNYDTEEEQDDSTRPVVYTEAYVYLDRDNDGVAELYKVCMVGDVGARTMLDEPEAVSQRPFAIFCPDPEPHTLVGLSIYDYVHDLQEIDSAVMRSTLDSLTQSVIPRTEVVDGMVNLRDLMSPEVAGIVRVKSPGMMREVKHSFVGGDTLPLMQFLDHVNEKRTGMSKASAGLDADALQSSTKAAVAATMSAAQQRQEMIARIFAETGMKDLFRGILKLIVENQQVERVVRLRNKYVKIDPRSWDANMDVIVNVALGQGLTEEKMQLLQGIAGKQEQILQMLGPDNPLVDLVQYRNTLARLVELSGFKNAAEFFKEITPEQMQQMQQAQQAQQGQQPQGDPAAMALAQVEMQKAQAQAQAKQAELQLKAKELQMREQEMLMQDDRERDKIAREMALKQYEIEVKHQTSLTEAEMASRVQAEKTAMELEAKKQAALDASTPRRRRVRLERDDSGRVSTAEIEEEEG